MKFQAIKPKKLSDVITEQIRELILQGELKPGDKLPPERELAASFGVSRPPVREAINALAATGLVEKHHGEGTIVRSMVSNRLGDPLTNLIITSEAKVIELMEVRRGMESWTAYHAALRRTDADVAVLETLLLDMQDELQDGKSSEHGDGLLHTAIASATHNVIWLHMMHTVLHVMDDYLKLIWHNVYLSYEDRELLFNQHCAVVAAIKGKQAQSAYDRMLEHLNFAEQKSINFLSQHSLRELLPQHYA